ncbi:hypothetical protein B0T16DRAFT_200121 [Cercophora newfieldiana]|uniref:Uncharacterized protein n=1 Tax=Cercophora newfieldiana TaxID=92897 RepID=A0AA39XUX8_9PEZI|nr:hypothetical protein B0T16DRAFT_200121 [Cercophora newfieldiana]
MLASARPFTSHGNIQLIEYQAMQTKSPPPWKRFLTRRRTLRDLESPETSSKSQSATPTSSATPTMADKSTYQGGAEPMPQERSPTQQDTSPTPTEDRATQTDPSISFDKTSQTEDAPDPPSQGKPGLNEEKSREKSDLSPDRHSSHQPTEGPDSGVPRLWAEAYGALKMSSKRQLVTAFEAILANLWPQIPKPEWSHLEDGFVSEVDHTATQEIIDTAVTSWLGGASGTAIPGRVSMLGPVGAAGKEIRRDNLVAWVAACVALHSVSNMWNSRAIGPSLPRVVSSIEWYGALQKLLLPGPGANRSRGEDEEPDGWDAHHEEGGALRKALVGLYTTVLTYLICLATGTDPLRELSEDGSDFETVLLKRESEVRASLDRYGVGENVGRLQPAISETVPTTFHGEKDDNVSSKLEKTGLSKTGSVSRSHAPVVKLPGIQEDRAIAEGSVWKWLLSHDHHAPFFDWGQKSSPLLWVTGPPGSGKSMLLGAAARHLTQKATVSASPSRVVFFFCNNRNSELENASLVARSLVEQLRYQQRRLNSHVAPMQANEQAGDNFLVIAKVLFNMVSDEDFEPTHFVIDAADECCLDGDAAEADHGLEDLLTIVAMTVSAASSEKVRWIISTDPQMASQKFNLVQDDPVLQTPTESATLKPLILDLGETENAEAMRPAAEEHVLYRAKKLTQDVRNSHALCETIAEKLSKGPKGNFLWPNLACEMIQARGSPWNAGQIIDELPATIPELYNHAMNAIRNFPMDDPEYCQAVLFTVAASHRLLYVSELDDIITLPLPVNPAMIIANRCAPFLEVLNQRVFFTHHSAREFLRERAKGGAPNIHADIARQCLAWMAKSMSNPRSFAKAAGGTDTKDSKEAEGAVKPTTHYALMYWPSHVADADLGRNQDVMLKVNEFLDKHFLSWIERLTPSGGLTQMLAQISRLERVLRKQLQQPTSIFHSCLPQVQFVAHFLRFHLLAEGGPEQADPRNTLLLCPDLGVMRSNLLGKESSWLKVWPRVKWSSSVLLSNGHTDWVRCCAYSPDGRWVASGSDDRTVRIWDPSTGQLQAVMSDLESWVYRVQFSVQGHLAAVVGSQLIIWRGTLPGWEKHVTRQELGFNENVPFYGVDEIAFSKDGKNLMLAVSTGSVICVLSLPSYKLLRSWTPGHAIRAMCFTPGGDLVVAHGNNLAVYSLEEEEPEKAQETEVGDGQEGEPGEAQEGEARETQEEGPKKPRELYSMEIKDDTLRSVCCSPDSEWIAAGSDEGHVCLWKMGADRAQPSLVKKFSGHEDWVVSVAFAADRPCLLSASDDRTLRIWDVDGPEDQKGQILAGHRSRVKSVACSPDGSQVVSSSTDCTVRLWDLDAARESNTEGNGAKGGDTAMEPSAPQGHTNSVGIVRFSPDGRLLASGDSSGKICLGDGNTGTLRASITSNQSHIQWLCFSEDGSKLASASNNYTVMVWDTATAARTHKFTDHSDWVRGVAFSPDGRFLASACDDTRVRMWDLTQGNYDQESDSDSSDSDSSDDDSESSKAEPEQPEKPAQTKESKSMLVKPRIFEGHSDYVRTVCFSSAGDLLASCGDDASIHLWQLTTATNDTLAPDSPDEEPERENSTSDAYKVLRSNEAVLAVAFYPDGLRLLSSSSDSVRIWQIDSGAYQVVQGGPFRSLQVNPSHPDWALTEMGPWYVNAKAMDGGEGAQPLPPRSSPLYLQSSGWIMWRDRRIVFLPEQYKPTPGTPSTWVQGNRVAIGSRSGEVLLFRFADGVAPAWGRKA